MIERDVLQFKILKTVKQIVARCGSNRVQNSELWNFFLNIELLLWIQAKKRFLRLNKNVWMLKILRKMGLQNSSKIEKILNWKLKIKKIILHRKKAIRSHCLLLKTIFELNDSYKWLTNYWHTNLRVYGPNFGHL